MPGFTVTGDLGSGTSGRTSTSTWSAVRIHDDRRVVIKILRVPDVAEARSHAHRLMRAVQRIGNEHLVRQHDALALADGTLALVFDELEGGSLAQVLGARGALSPGETITTVAPLFGALAELHTAGMVHGDLTPETVLFSGDGRPQMIAIGAIGLLGRRNGARGEASGFVAPEVAGGAAPSPASDVYAMAAIGWFCLAGVSPVPAAEGATLTLGPETPPRLVQVLTSCLCTDPGVRPSAGMVATEVFDASRAEPVRMESPSDPAAEITRRIRLAAVPASPRPQARNRKGHRTALTVVIMALVVALALVSGATLFWRLHPEATGSLAARSAVRVPELVGGQRARGAAVPQKVTDVVTVRSSPKLAAMELLQALADARALAYAARDPGLLDLVYAPDAPKAALDRSNIAAALRNGATYLGLGFVVKDVAYLDGTSDTARIRATIVTPAYTTGHPDGRKLTHNQETVGPSVFTVGYVPDGWRILSMTAP
ncbi:MAG: protein kinase [Actinomycetota bacterium]